MKEISIVIPVFNEQDFIGGLLESIAKINYPKSHYEVVVVNDGSTDSTAEVVKSFSDVRLIELIENMGRYKTRKTGAEAALFPNILFIDARSEVDPDILNALDRLGARAITGHSLGRERPGPFETFYLTVRRLMFRKFLKNSAQPVIITRENFDTMPKGTTVFFVKKEILFAAYQALSHIDIGKNSSDDTSLLREVVQQVPILIHPGVRITNFARTSFTASVKHLFARGPKFVDYYLKPSKRNFWLVIVFPLNAFAIIITGFIFIPLPFLAKIGFLVALDLIAALFLSRSLREFSITLLMLPVCTLIFYTGILWGIFLKLQSITKTK